MLKDAKTLFSIIFPQKIDSKLFKCDKKYFDSIKAIYHPQKDNFFTIQCKQIMEEFQTLMAKT